MMKEEIFGPVLPVFPFKNISEVIKFINERDKPLAVYYFGQAGSLACKRLCAETSSGAFVINEVVAHILNHSMGFGGVGKSGYGRHGGFEGFKNFSNRKGILVKGPAPKAIYGAMSAPYSPKMQNFLRKWLPTLLVVNKSTVWWYTRIVLVLLAAVIIKYVFF